MRVLCNSKGLRVFAAGAFLICILLYSTSSRADESEDTFTVRMEARADGTGFSARHKAILAAQEQIIREVLEALAPGTDERVFRPILQNAGSYIKSYQVLRFDTYSQNVRIEIDAEVREDALQKDVATIMVPRLTVLPSLLLFMSEYLPETPEPILGGETTACQTLIQQLEKQRIEVGVAETLTLHYSTEELIKACEGDIDTAAAYARSSLKDVVIFGKADAQVQENTLDSNINRHLATVTLHVFRGSDGKKIDAFQQTAAVLSVDPVEGAEQAIRDACGKLVYELTTATVIAALGAKHQSYVMMTVEESGTRERFDRLVNVLNMNPHVRKVDVLHYSDSLARIKIDYDGPMGDLRDYLDKYSYAGMLLVPKRIVERTMVMRFVNGSE